jgi:hypothetical protein
MLLLLGFLFITGALVAESYDNPSTLKKLMAERKQLNKVKRAIVLDSTYSLTPTYSELLLKNNFETRGVQPSPRKIPAIAQKWFGTLPPEIIGEILQEPESSEEKLLHRNLRSCLILGQTGLSAHPLQIRKDNQRLQRVLTELFTLFGGRLLVQTMR